MNSTWGATDAFHLDHAPRVGVGVKNDHFGFEVFYAHRTVVRKYRPGFRIGLLSGDMLVRESKGRVTDCDRTKRSLLVEWVKVANALVDLAVGPAMSRRLLGDIHGILAYHSRDHT